MGYHHNYMYIYIYIQYISLSILHSGQILTIAEGIKKYRQANASDKHEYTWAIVHCHVKFPEDTQVCRNHMVEYIHTVQGLDI